MYEYDEECLKTFILNQGQLFDEPVAETLEEAEAFVRKTVNEIGYDRAETGFDGHTCAVMVALDQQSPDIAMGVDKALEARESKMSDEEIEEASEVFALPDGRYLIVEG